MRRCVLLLTTGALVLVASCDDSGSAPEAREEVATPSPSEEPIIAEPTEEESEPPSDDPREGPAETEGFEGGESDEGAEDDFSGSEFPQPVEVEQGGRYWGAYFAVTRGGVGDPKLERVADDLRTIGFDPSVGGIECDEGAKDQLGLSPRHSYNDVALYFATEAEARDFVGAYDPGAVGVARVRTFCLD